MIRSFNTGRNIKTFTDQQLEDLDHILLYPSKLYGSTDRQKTMKQIISRIDQQLEDLDHILLYPSKLYGSTDRQKQ